MNILKHKALPTLPIISFIWGSRKENIRGKAEQTNKVPGPHVDACDGTFRSACVLG